MTPLASYLGLVGCSLSICGPAEIGGGPAVKVYAFSKSGKRHRTTGYSRFGLHLVEWELRASKWVGGKAILAQCRTWTFRKSEVRQTTKPESSPACCSSLASMAAITSIGIRIFTCILMHVGVRRHPSSPPRIRSSPILNSKNIIMMTMMQRPRMSPCSCNHSHLSRLTWEEPEASLKYHRRKRVPTTLRPLNLPEMRRLEITHNPKSCLSQIPVH